MTREVRPVEAAAKALARRDRSTADLTAYLERRGVAPMEAARTAERLAAAGYVDDRRFAVGSAKALAGRGWGDAAIRDALAKSGLPGEAVDEALAALDAEEERAVALADRLGRSPRVARRLSAKGFSEETIESVFADAWTPPS
jgi:regulatory protein